RAQKHHEGCFARLPPSPLGFGGAVGARLSPWWSLWPPRCTIFCDLVRKSYRAGRQERVVHFFVRYGWHIYRKRSNLTEDGSRGERCGGTDTRTERRRTESRECGSSGGTVVWC